MELRTGHTRPIRMMYSRAIRGLIAAAALAAILAGCGTTVVSSGTNAGTGARPGSGSGAGSAASTTSTTAAAGCANVNAATKLTAVRAMHLVEPARFTSMLVTQTNPGIVRALFRDFCQVIAHRGASSPVTCPMAIGLSYGGMFYAGARPLARYTYAASGCEIVTLTPAGTGARSQSAMVMGAAAAAAPNLHADMARALGMAQAQVFHPSSQVNQGSGPSK